MQFKVEMVGFVADNIVLIKVIGVSFLVTDYIPTFDEENPLHIEGK